MILFSSDTSTKSLSVAVCRDENTLGAMTKQTGTTHSQTYLPAVLELLSDCGLTFSDVDLFVCTAGPGSYTGIRIGIATTKTMAYAAGKGAIGISTLETLAFPHLDENAMVCPVLDARNRRVFSAGYRGAELVIPEANRSLDELLEQISQNLTSNPTTGAPSIVFCGDAAALCREDPAAREWAESEKKAGRVAAASFLSTVPEAADAARIAYRRFCAAKAADERAATAEGKNAAAATDPFALEARYLSPSQAERMKTKRQPAQSPAAAVSVLQAAAESAPREEEPSRPETISIREAVPSDLDALSRLEQECFAIPWSRESLANDLTENREVASYLVAERQGEIAGYIGMWQVLDEAQITDLAVAKNARGKGIGASLLRALCRKAAERGIVRLTLEVRPSNIPARKIYEAAGFEEIAKRKAYYRDNGEDAIIMLKKLPQNDK